MASSAEFRPKGRQAEPWLGARCLEREPGVCHINDKLVFEVAGAKKGEHVAAYAECEGRERIWYFPTRDGWMPAGSSAESVHVIDQAARVGPEHGTGRCTVHLRLTERLVDRSALITGQEPSVLSVVVPLTIVQ
jgi:hypothetical protein